MQMSELILIPAVPRIGGVKQINYHNNILHTAIHCAAHTDRSIVQVLVVTWTKSICNDIYEK